MKKQIYNCTVRALLAIGLITFFSQAVLAEPPSHDPSQIIKAGSRYYVFSTGSGVWVMSSSSSDFSTWQGETSPFASGNPSWISSYVSGFGGIYWAPDCIYMNGKYYLYYSVSMGARPCAIGVTTSTSLSSPSWTDQGMVVYSDNSSVYGSIDPDVLFDQSGNLWMVYGSHLNGIVLAQLNTSTGKTLNSTRYNLANDNCEAASIIYHSPYYYLFFNRNTCCAGYNSDYTIYMGRSSKITGPYYDKNGVNCANYGGSVFLETNGRFIGPGHFGYSESKLTYHFYDGNDGGNAKLMVSTLSWSNGWPVAATLNSGGSSISAGTFTITNRNSSKVLDATNCSTADGANIQQWTSLGNTCQQWIIASAGSGYYTIKNANSGKMLDAVNCGFWDGTNVDQWTSNGLTCQQWSFVNIGSGYYRIVNRKNGKDLEVASASTSDGANVQLWESNGCYCQHWSLTKLKSGQVTEEPVIAESEEIDIFPAQTDKELFVNGAAMGSPYEIYTLKGTLALKGTLDIQRVDVSSLIPGIYVMKLTSIEKVVTFKFIKN